MLHLCLIIQIDGPAKSTLHEGLESFGIKPFTVTTRTAANDVLTQMQFDCIVVEMNGGGRDTQRCLPDLGKLGVPVVLLSDPLDEARQIWLLESGAWEIVARPVSARLVALKLTKLIEMSRDRKTPEPTQLEVGAIRLDARTLSATFDRVPLVLSAKQFDLLFILAARAGQFVHRHAIGRALRLRAGESSRSIDMQVSRIRRSLREAGDNRASIHTVHGLGYCLTVTPRGDAAQETELAICV